MNSRVLEILEDLIALPSVNPALDADGAGEDGVARYVEAFCLGVNQRVATESATSSARAASLEISRQSVLPGRDNVIVRLDLGLPLTLLFEAHMDTVPAGEMPNAFVPRLEAGLLYGRGTCDTKATLAGMLTALEDAAFHPEELTCNVLLCCAVDEEHGAKGIAALVQSGHVIDGAVVGEPTELRLVIAHKGCSRFVVRTVGKAAHTSVPHQGESAILRMARVLDFIRNQYQPELDAKSHPLCGSPTLAIGTIHGGTAINIVPDRCEIQLDRRLIPGEEAAAVMHDFARSLTHYLGPSDPPPEIRPLLLDPPLNTSPDAAVVRAAARVLEAMGLDAACAGVPYGSDASKLQGLQGVPTIVFGPGSIAQAHTANEYVPLSEVELAARFYRQLTRSFGREPTGGPPEMTAA